MSPKSLTAPAALALTLAACTAKAPPPQTPPPETAQAIPEVGPSCHAEEFAGYVGTPASDATIAAIQAKRGDAAIRVIKPGMAVTMDYRADRLNVDVDAAGKIKRFYCS